MRWLFSVRFHLIAALALCILGAAGLWWGLTDRQHTWLRWLACWMLACNVVTFVYYGLDKWLAMRTFFFRIPEVTLHTLAAVGGSPAALLAMWIFRHKTIKASFRILFWVIVGAQIALSAYVAKLLWWN
ncbi:MAG: DUF1294 domain-containing protein [Planctomycetes bacterium]|nr:DUF1294 domain-containing protein [Planctomycetota bacterium]